MKHAYTILLQYGERSGYVVSCPSIPNIMIEAGTVRQALAMMRVAITKYLESCRKEGIAIPENREALIGHITVTLPPEEI